MHSTPRLHSETEDHSISYNHFSIIDQAQYSQQLRILESMYLVKEKPSLNTDKTAEPLHIVH